MDMHDGRKVAYLCVGLAASCGSRGLTQSTCGFGLTARRSDPGPAVRSLAFGPRREHLSRVEQSESVKVKVKHFVPRRLMQIGLRE